MNTKDVDFTKISIPADEFDTMMRRALDVPLVAETETSLENSEKPFRKDKPKTVNKRTK